MSWPFAGFSILTEGLRHSSAVPRAGWKSPWPAAPEAGRLVWTAHQYTLGKPRAEQTGSPTEEIRWDEGRHSTLVYPNEVFTADEAADIFYAYFLTDAVPETLVLRELDLS